MTKHIRRRSTARFFAAGAVLATSLALGHPVQAQQGRQQQSHQQHDARGNQRDRTERRIAQLTQRLQLSSGQAGQIRRILADERQQFQAHRPTTQNRAEARNGANARGQQRTRRAPSPENVAIRQRSEQQIERVLNDRQRAEYRKLRAEHQRNARDRQGGEHRDDGRNRARK